MSSGRSGDGPGELRAPFAVVAGPGGLVGVADVRLRKVIVFRDSGGVYGEVRLPGAPTDLVEIDSCYVTAGWITPSGGPVLGRLELRNGTVMWAVPVFTKDPELIVRNEGSGTASPFLSFVRIGKDRFLVANPLLYRIDVIDASGSIALWAQRDLHREPLSRDEVEEQLAALERVMGSAPGRKADIQSALRRSIVNQTKAFFVAGGLVQDEAHRVWVVTKRGAPKRTEIDVFDSTGTFAGTVTAAGAVKALAFRGSAAALVVESPEDGESRLVFAHLKAQ